MTVDPFAGSPDFARLYGDPEALSPRMASQLWTTAIYLADTYADSDASDLLKRELPPVARRMADDVWMERFVVCFEGIAARLARGRFASSQLASCTGEEMALHLVIDAAEAAVSDVGPEARVAGQPAGSSNLLDLGGGIRPDLVGQGLGAAGMAAVLTYARNRFSPAGSELRSRPSTADQSFCAGGPDFAPRLPSGDPAGESSRSSCLSKRPRSSRSRATRRLAFRGASMRVTLALNSLTQGRAV